MWFYGKNMCFEGRQIIFENFFLWLCDLNVFFNLLDSQFSHLQNGRYNVFLSENVVRNTENAYYLFFCPVSGKNWNGVWKKKKKRGMDYRLSWDCECKEVYNEPPFYPLSLSPFFLYMFLSPFPLPSCLNCIFCMRGNFLFLSFH